jgi:cytochrome c biogenesis protein CcmG, thiol:disulfide interchange protein DsbE
MRPSRRARAVGRAAAAIGWTTVVVLLCFCGAAGAADTIADLAIDFRMNPLDGQAAPAFTLSALDGKRLSLADFKGQVVLLYFWASW